jgi:predicted amidohydrolase
MRVATVQLTSTENKDAIRERADSLTRRAVSAGAELVVRRPEVYA